MKAKTTTTAIFSLLFLASIAFVPGVQAVPSGTENFEDDALYATVPAEAETWYTYAADDVNVGSNANLVYVDNDQSYSTTHSLHALSSTTHHTGPIFTRPSSGSWCSYFPLSFKFRISALQTVNPMVFGFDPVNTVLGSGSGPNNFNVKISTAGIPTFNAGGSSTFTANFATSPTIATNQWYQLTFTGQNLASSPTSACPQTASGTGQNSYISATLKSLPSGADLTAIIFNPAFNSDATSTNIPDNFFFAADANTGNAVWPDTWMDDFTITGLDTTPLLSTIAATYTTANSIGGFDVSKSGDFVAVREGNPNVVKTLEGFDLSLDDTESTNCNRLHGLTTLQDDAVAFLSCGATLNDVTTIKVLDKFGTPYDGGFCSTTDAGAPDQACDGSFDITSFDEETYYDFAPLVPSIIHVSSSGPGGFTNQMNYFVLGATKTNGKVTQVLLAYSYYATSTSSHTNAEAVHENLVQYTSGVPTGICGVGGLKNIVSTSSAQVKEIDSVVFTYPDELPPRIAGTLTLATAGNAVATGVQSVDCNGSIVIFQSPTVVGAFNINTGTLLWSQSVTTAVSAVSISDFVDIGQGNEGPFGSYQDDGTTYIINATNGVRLARISDVATVEEVGINNIAQSLYVQSNLRIDRYDIHLQTTGNAAGPGDAGGCIINCDVNGTYTSTGSSSGSGSGSSSVGVSSTLTGAGGFITNAPAQNTNNPLGHAIRFASDAWGFDFAILFGMAITLGIVIFVARRSDHVLVIAAALLIAVIVCFFLGLFPLWVLLIITFLIIAVAGRTMFKRDDDGE